MTSGDAQFTVARVLMDLSLDRSFDYFIPAPLRSAIGVGVRVRVPFGRGGALREAYVVGLASESAHQSLKLIDSVVEKHPRIPDSLIRLAEWMSDYYCCTREQAVRNLLPGAVRSGKIKAKTVTQYTIADAEAAGDYLAALPKRLKARGDVLRYLFTHRARTADQIHQDTGAGKSVLDALTELKLVEKIAVETDRDPFRRIQVMPTLPLTPTPEQAKALDLIFKMIDHPDQVPSHVLLLHGVTCSGKTEVYLQTIAHVLECGGDAIVLVPEISLTPQTVTRFKSRFGDSVSVLHSGLSDGERYDEWMKVHSGRVRIAVGARSALFAPFKNLKLIVVDEEHENSYKQSEAPRYNARDVAVMRGKMEHALVILGSATPSLESYQNAQSGKYVLSEMLRRSQPGIVMPSVTIVDMAMEKTEQGIPYFSKMLVEAVYDRLRLGEQCILFLNKRGFARKFTCDCCGYVAECPDCSVAYTYHKKSRLLTCHLCGGAISAPSVCPSCGQPDILYQGAGTERIETQASKLFPHARIARMDSDTMTRPQLYEETLSAFRRGDLDILIGTQMIAKGLDFPNVTLVGIINADMGLYLEEDFRSVERTFQLLAQVAGRAGRGEVKGEVMIQTLKPYNTAIQCAAEHDYKGFFKEEIFVREEMHFPPFGHLIALHFDGPDAEKVLCSARSFYDRVKPMEKDPELLFTEPAPAPIERIKGKSRFLMLVRGTRLTAFRKFLRHEIMTRRAASDGVDFYADIDALSLM